jgi:N-acetyldiaminopimelate deacetylase
MPVSEEDLKTYRRDLHKIPELALAEFKTHRYLLEKIQSWQTNFMTIRQVEELPTGNACEIFWD